LALAASGAFHGLVFAQAAQPQPGTEPVSQVSESAPTTSAAAGGPQLKPAAEDGWHFKIAPYLWVPGQKGNVTVRGNSVPVDLSVGESFEAVIDNFNMAFAFRAELSKEQWSIMADVMYTSLEVTDIFTSSGPFVVRQDQGIFEFGAAYEAVNTPLTKGSADSAKFSLAPLAGVRAHYLSLELENSVIGEVSKSKGWVDAFVGVRARLEFSDAFSMVARADIGAGGADFTWNALAGIDWRLSPTASVIAGYRALDVDYSDGSGAGQFEYDLLLHGPYAGAEIRF
jgi:hypothetical protein